MKKSQTLARRPPFETEQLRAALNQFFQKEYKEPKSNETRNIGSYKWGVYLFYDYDDEPIYVGQTREQISQRIGRHLTNQRTDAVAMSVLDPFEVFSIEVWPLPEFQNVNSRHADFTKARQGLDALEYAVHKHAIENSKFQAILNEKDPREPLSPIALPPSVKDRVVTDEVLKLRSHLDTRIARRAQIVSRLSQTISERQVQGGLRRTLLTQARRLQQLAEARYIELGGEAIVEKGAENAGDEGED